MGMKVRPGKLMPQRIQDAFERADVITFDWSFGDFTGGELPRRQTPGYDSRGRSTAEVYPLAIRNSGELVEFEIKFVRVG